MAAVHKIRPVHVLVRGLLSSRWRLLSTGCHDLPDAEYPGVYLLAYDAENLADEPVKAKDVLYVGMSRSQGGVRGRLGHLLKAIEGKGGHSGGNRFFKGQLRHVPYSQSKRKGKLYVAAVCLPCEVRKKARKLRDLMIMGEVARLEYYVLARVKKLNGKEPPLNWQ